MINRGLDIEKEKNELTGDKYQFGAFSDPCITDLANIDRKPYLPHGEVQNLGEEKFDCVSRGFNNILETKFNWLIKNNKLQKENVDWLKNKGYINEEGMFEVSDAFVAINSGTTRQGNSMKAPVQAIHECGLIPKKFMVQLLTFDTHHDPKRITPELKSLGLEFLSRFPINYEQVKARLMPTLLEEDIVNVAGYAWPYPDSDGTYPKNESPFNHDFILFQLPMSYAFDNYPDSYDGDFIKKLAPDYIFMDYGYRVYISKENTIIEAEKISILQQYLIALKQLILLYTRLIAEKLGIKR